MSQTSRTKTTLVYSSQQHLHERYSIRVWKLSKLDVVKRIEERISRRQTSERCIRLIDEIILNQKAKIVKRRMQLA